MTGVDQVRAANGGSEPACDDGVSGDVDLD